MGRGHNQRFKFRVSSFTFFLNLQPETWNLKRFAVPYLSNCESAKKPGDKSAISRGISKILSRPAQPQTAHSAAAFAPRFLSRRIAANRQ
jgi:hypothetical protein